MRPLSLQQSLVGHSSPSRKQRRSFCRWSHFLATFPRFSTSVDPGASELSRPSFNCFVVRAVRPSMCVCVCVSDCPTLTGGSLSTTSNLLRGPIDTGLGSNDSYFIADVPFGGHVTIRHKRTLDAAPKSTKNILCKHFNLRQKRQKFRKK